MIEVHYAWDLLPGIDPQGYGEWARKAISSLLKAPGFVEVRAQRNMLGLPQGLAISVWQTMADWAKYNESAEWQAFMAELRDKWATNFRVEIWGPSPVVPEPIRPG